MSFAVFVDFVSVSALWYLQHVTLLGGLCNEFEISTVELTAIWKRFQEYDANLSGYISSGDLVLFLQVCVRVVVIAFILHSRLTYVARTWDRLTL